MPRSKSVVMIMLISVSFFFFFNLIIIAAMTTSLFKNMTFIKVKWRATLIFFSRTVYKCYLN